MFATDRQDKRPANVVNNNLLVLKLLLKEEKKFFYDRLLKDTPKESDLTNLRE